MKNDVPILKCFNFVDFIIQIKYYKFIGKQCDRLYTVRFRKYMFHSCCRNVKRISINTIILYGRILRIYTVI